MAIAQNNIIYASEMNTALSAKLDSSAIKGGTMVKTFTLFKRYNGSPSFYRSYVDVPWTEFGCTASRKASVMFTPADVFDESWNYCKYYTIVYGYDDSTATNCRIYIVEQGYNNEGAHRFSYLIWN